MRFLSVVMLLGTLLPPLIAAGPGAGEAVVVAVFAPWTSGRDAIAAASLAGPIAASGPMPFVVYVGSEDGQAARRLRAQGAWLVLSSNRRRFCGT
jgi:hypothetical protein